MLLTYFPVVAEKEFNFPPQLGSSHLNIHQDFVSDEGSSSLWETIHHCYVLTHQNTHSQWMTDTVADS